MSSHPPTSTPTSTPPASEASTEVNYLAAKSNDAATASPVIESPACLEIAPEPTDDVTAAELLVQPEPEFGVGNAAIAGPLTTEMVLAPRAPGAAVERPPANLAFTADALEVRRHNFIVFALYQIIVRVSWIFKTESIIVPAMLDSIDPTKGTLRSWLPLLSRFGQSIPPLFYAPWLKRVPYKKVSVFTTTLGMALTLMVLAVGWLWVDRLNVQSLWMPATFLLLYAVFFSFVGTNQLAFSTLQGKLIHVTSRGRQMLVANLLGVIIAVAFAMTLLPLWLNSTKANYFLILGFSGLTMAVAAFSALWLRETPETHGDSGGGSRNYLVRVVSDAYTLLKTDRNYRRLSLVAMLFGASMLLFPHYQAYAFGEFGLNLRQMITWVIVQNVGTALFSVLLGPLADKRGNRLSLQLLMFGLTLIPLLAILLVHLGEVGRNLYWLVFLLIGMMPVTIRSLHNYTLEISEPADHARYLGTLSLAAAAPLLLSPPLGLLLTYAGFEIVFSLIAAVLGVGWLVTFTLQEPRNGES